MPPGLYQYSIIVSTPQREMKFTAPSKERHDIWLNVGIHFFIIFTGILHDIRLCNSLIHVPPPTSSHLEAVSLCLRARCPLRCQKWKKVGTHRLFLVALKAGEVGVSLSIPPPVDGAARLSFPSAVPLANAPERQPWSTYDGPSAMSARRTALRRSGPSSTSPTVWTTTRIWTSSSMRTPCLMEGSRAWRMFVHAVTVDTPLVITIHIIIHTTQSSCNLSPHREHLPAMQADTSRPRKTPLGLSRHQAGRCAPVPVARTD
jgi:hypothetical protein